MEYFLNPKVLAKISQKYDFWVAEFVSNMSYPPDDSYFIFHQIMSEIQKPEELKKEDIPTTPVSSTAPVSAGSNEDFSRFKINKKGFMEIDGEVVETLPSITFKVRLENDHEVLARLSGRMRLNKIMLLPGDRVRVEMTPYDLNKGRITYRY